MVWTSSRELSCASTTSEWIGRNFGGRDADETAIDGAVTATLFSTALDS